MLSCKFTWLKRTLRNWPWMQAPHGFAPFYLPYVPRAGDIREWNVEINPPGIATPRPLPSNNPLRISLHRILIETGIALTLARTTSDPRSWFALYRYGADFAGTAPRLRFYSGVTQKDSRLTAVASEEIAIGIAWYILRQFFALPHIADVNECFRTGELRYVHRRLNNRRPDYLCTDSANDAVLVECKGTTGTRSDISGMLQDGDTQVRNVTPTNLTLRNTCGRMVIGTHFCVEGKHPRSETTTIIEDPDGAESGRDDPESDMVVRLSYAKCLRFMGQDVFAERLIAKTPMIGFPDLDKERLPEIDEIPFLPLGVTPFNDLVGIVGPIAMALLSNIEGNIKKNIADSLPSLENNTIDLGTKGYILSNGVIVLHDIDSVLEEVI